MNRFHLTSMADGQAGVAGHMHYDPYFPRLLNHVKRLLAENVPVLIRLHPGTSYPMAEETLHYRVDREGHVVALVGYDDAQKHFLVADPWNQGAWGGDRGGLTTLPYEHAMICMVDSSLGATMLAIPWAIEVSVPEVMPLNQPVTMEAHIKYPCPEPLSSMENHVSHCRALLELPSGLEFADAAQSLQALENGFLQPGDEKTVRFTLVRTGAVDGMIKVRARGIVTNNDPYLYSDIIGGCGLMQINVDKATDRTRVSAPQNVAVTVEK